MDPRTGTRTELTGTSFSSSNPPAAPLRRWVEVDGIKKLLHAVECDWWRERERAGDELNLAPKLVYWREKEIASLVLPIGDIGKLVTHSLADPD